jgi:streptolysin S family bacteriocin protoxin
MRMPVPLLCLRLHWKDLLTHLRVVYAEFLIMPASCCCCCSCCCCSVGDVGAAQQQAHLPATPGWAPLRHHHQQGRSCKVRLPLISIRDPSHARRCCCKPVHVCHICTQCFRPTDCHICHPAVYTCHEPATGSLSLSQTTQCASSTQQQWQSSCPFTGCGPHQQQQH